MDNKQNREFYWELKDFLNGTKPLTESRLPKQESLKDSIKKMLVQVNPLHNPAPTHKFIAEELSNFSKNTMDVVVDFISKSEVEVQKGKSDCKAFTSNITENLFSVQKKSLLSEQSGGFGGSEFGGGDQPTSSNRAQRRQQEFEAARQRRMEKREAERAEKAKQRAQRERERAEDEAYQFNKEIEAEEQSNKQQAAAKREQASESDIEQMRRTAEEQGGVPAEAVTSAETLRLRQEAERQGGVADQTTDQERRIAAEQEKANKLKAEAQAMERGTGRARLQMQTDDPNTPEDESLLPANTPANRAALRAYREEKSKQRRTENLKRDLEVLQGKDVSQLSDWEKFRVKYAQDQLAKDAEIRGRVATAMEKDAQERGAAGMYGPTPSGGNLADNLFQRAMAIDKSQLKLSPAKSSVPDTRISGTSMTYGQFKALTGRNYDAFSDIDRRTVINMAGAGKITPGNYDPNRMSESERLMMIGYQTAAGMPQTEGPRQAALYRSSEDLRQLEAQVAAAKNRTPEERRAAGRASYQAYLQTPEGQALYKSLQSGSNQPAQQPARQQTQSVVNSFKAPAAMQNQMTQTQRTPLSPGSRASIENQLKRLRGM